MRVLITFLYETELLEVLSGLFCQIITMHVYLPRRGRHATMKVSSRSVVSIKCHDDTSDEPSSPPLVLIADNDSEVTKVSAQ